MLINLIKKVRRQPKPVRDKVAMTIAGTFTGLVFVFWVFNFPARDLAIINQNEEGSVFSDVFNQIIGQYATVKESINAANATSTLEEQKGEENSATSSIEDNFLIIDKDNKVWSAVSSSSNHQINSDEAELNMAATTSTSTTAKNESARAVRIIPVSNSTATTGTTTANN